MVKSTTIPRIADELNNALVVRRALIDRARHSLRREDLAGALLDVFDVLEHLQKNDESLLRLHADCHGLIEYTLKVLERDLVARPVVVHADSLQPEPRLDSGLEDIDVSALVQLAREACPGTDPVDLVSVLRGRLSW